jgi:hypothetical protein
MNISKNKLLATATVVIMLVSMFTVLSSKFVNAAYLDVNGYAYLKGVLGNDTQSLYPYTNTPLNIGFSKYGEMINPNALASKGVGLSYHGLDPFANFNVDELLWNEGWLMNITYIYSDVSHNVWAYALFSDEFNCTNPNWVTKAVSPLDQRTGYTGGRKTNGYAETAPMKVLYDGPRRVIVLLNTTIYDPNITAGVTDKKKGLPLVSLYIQVDFNKDQKYVLLIKDIKLLTQTKPFKSAQVKFSERGQWDIGWTPVKAPASYAHFYHDLPTKYFLNPWYMVDDGEHSYNGWHVTGYDLCQMIDQKQQYVGYAAYWPNLMSWRVEGFDELTQAEMYKDISDWYTSWTGSQGTTIYDTYGHAIGEQFQAAVPGYYQAPLYYPGGPSRYEEYDWNNPGNVPEQVSFPPTWGFALPEVYVNGVKLSLAQLSYDFEPGLPAGYQGHRSGPGLEVDAIPGTFVMTIPPQADTAAISVHWKLYSEQDDMTYEPDTPYVMGEYVFDMSGRDSSLPTTQFRCITVYGLNDLNDGNDYDINGNNNYLDRETLYQLDTVFNPWDLRQAFGQDDFAWWNDYPSYAFQHDFNPLWLSSYMRDYWPGKWTERWVQNYTGDGTQDTFWLSQQIVVPGPSDDPGHIFPAWDAYCSPREKVLVNGVLQIPGTDYEIYWNMHPEETLATGALDLTKPCNFTLKYPRIYPGSEYVWIAYPDGTYYEDWNEYNIDYTDGRLYIADLTLPKDYSLMIDYYLNFPASEIVFYKASVPKAGARVEVLYSAFRITYQTDKFIYGIDGEIEENNANGVDYNDLRTFWLRYGPVVPYSFIKHTVNKNTYWNWIDVSIDGIDIPENNEGWLWELNAYGVADDTYKPYDMYVQYGPACITLNYESIDTWLSDKGYDLRVGDGSVIEVTYPVFSGRYEWTAVGTGSGAVDSAGASMVTEGLRQWTNFDTKLAGLDYKDAKYGPYSPFLFRNITGTNDKKASYYDTHKSETTSSPQPDGMTRFKDNWCTTLPISSSNIIVVGGTSINLAAEYFNDFTDSYVTRIAQTWGTGFTSSACWSRNLYVDTPVPVGADCVGYATISTYKDLNGTIGLIIQGWTGEDTYYACYAMQHGLPAILKELQPGMTSIVLKFDYSKHPSQPGFFTVVECLGTFTESAGFDYELWDEIGPSPSSGKVVYKMAMNSYSSEYWIFETTINFTVEKVYDIPYVMSAEISYPQEIYFSWPAELHPDPPNT